MNHARPMDGMDLVVFLPGRPMAAPRPRVLRSGRSFNPKGLEYKRAAEKVRVLLPEGFEPLEEPILASFSYAFRIPKGWSKGRRTAHHEAPRTSLPDLSNLVKAAEDFCEGILWENDKLICEIRANKFWSLGEEGTWIGLKLLNDAEDAP